MNQLITRIIKLSEEIEKFPLGQCSPSDDPDKQMAYLYSFKALVKRFMSSAKSLDDNKLKDMMNEIDADPESIIDAYDLQAEMQGIIDYINDTKTKPNKIKARPNISGKSANELSDIIQECLISESEDSLPMICNGYGLIQGTIEEAYKSKFNYVHSRIAYLEPNDIYELGLHMKGKYPNSKLDDLLDILAENDGIGLISEFENIQKVLKQEIDDAKFTIWIAVAWFTDNMLLNRLYLKSKEGLNIQIILNDDEINSKLKDKLNKFFDVHWVPKNQSFNKLMHNKFCVIDLKIAMHGSYNWTNKAQFNNETISVINNRICAEDFAEQFLKLKHEISKNTK